MGRPGPETGEIPRRNLPDNIGSHFVIATLFSVGLVIRPRETFKELVTKGPQSIAEGYRKFYKNTRPQISY